MIVQKENKQRDEKAQGAGTGTTSCGSCGVKPLLTSVSGLDTTDKTVAEALRSVRGPEAPHDWFGPGSGMYPAT